MKSITFAGKTGHLPPRFQASPYPHCFADHEVTIMLQDPDTVRHYQNLTDTFTNLWDRGYRADDLRMYLDGYLAALRRSNTIDLFQINRLEETATRFLYDPANFEPSYY